MRYFRIFDDINYPNRWYLGDINIDDNWILTYGVPVYELIGKTLSVEVYKNGTHLDFSLTEGYGVPIVSENFAKCLQEFQNEVQLIPVDTPNESSRFYILVITSKIDCVDEERSDFEKYKIEDEIRPDKAGDYKSFFKLKIDVSQINKNIFRLTKFDIAIIISEEFKTRIENSHLSGLQFELVS